MTLRTLIAAVIYASGVPIVGGMGPWGAPLAAFPGVRLEAPGAMQDHPREAGPILAARLDSRDASRGIAAALAEVSSRERQPLWISYTVPSVSRRGDHRLGQEAPARCVLGEDGFDGRGAGGSDAVHVLRVFARLDRRAITRIAMTDADCTVDAGSQTVVEFQGVRPDDSVRWLSGLVLAADASQDAGEPTEHHTIKGALAAIALTDDPSADDALSRFVAPEHPRGLRRDAAFWLGAARGAAGARVVTGLVKDADEEFRSHLTFVLTLIGPGGIDTLIDLARHDASGRVRGQALFWLAQKAGQRAVGTLSEAIRQDPDSEVRKRAVFAVSQLPRDEGVPMLIRLARTHPDPGVRQQAMFWLGESGDSRALAFFEDVLKR